MLKSGPTDRHPFTSLLLLLLLMFAGAFLFTILAFAIIIPVYGMQSIMNVSGFNPGEMGPLRLIQIFSSTGMFIVPALFFAKLESTNWTEYLGLRKVTLMMLVFAVLIMLSSGPLLEWSLQLNKSMKLPAFLKDIEDWMRLKEQEMAVMTKMLLKMDSVPLLLVNLLMLAIIPAIGEEFIFRGCLQKILARWTGNQHAAIWIAAIIFSTIHFQFYGFIPRMLLGALFGYFLVWSGSIWVPVLAHFMNNSVAVITAYVYQQNGISLDKMDKPDPVSWMVYVACIPLTVMLLWVFYQRSQEQRKYLEYGDGSRLD